MLGHENRFLRLQDSRPSTCLPKRMRNRPFPPIDSGRRFCHGNRNSRFENVELTKTTDCKNTKWSRCWRSWDEVDRSLAPFIIHATPVSDIFWSYRLRHAEDATRDKPAARWS
jgi:hypothetical protein